jgi:ribosomal protein S18 acetylase RimI-like enzyme
MDRAVIARLPVTRLAEVLAVFDDSFAAYPVMRFVVGDGHADYEARLRRLIELFVTRRYHLGGPVFGLEAGGALAGAATVTLPGEGEPPPAMVALADDVWRELGADARARYDAYSAAVRPFPFPQPHYHLNMLGVRAAHQGRGFARPLVDAVRMLSDADPTSLGVSLTTETPRNITLYEHLGFRVVAHTTIAPGFESWGLFSSGDRVIG